MDIDSDEEEDAKSDGQMIEEQSTKDEKSDEEGSIQQEEVSGERNIEEEIEAYEEHTHEEGDSIEESGEEQKVEMSEIDDSSDDEYIFSLDDRAKVCSQGYLALYFSLTLPQIAHQSLVEFKKTLCQSHAFESFSGQDRQKNSDFLRAIRNLMFLKRNTIQAIADPRNLSSIDSLLEPLMDKASPEPTLSVSNRNKRKRTDEPSGQSPIAKKKNDRRDKGKQKALELDF